MHHTGFRSEESQESASQKLTFLINLTDPIVHFVSCYEQALNRYDEIENKIEEEFSHFV